MFQLNDHVSEEGLRNLKYYKYASIDKSPIANYILKHYWNYAITLFPLWIAPNLITLIGFVFVVFNFLLALYYIPNLTATEDSPSWIFFSFAVGLWLYSTFDNVDGKQARRTGTSSPLGELFDHGVDALNCTFGALVQAAGLGLGYSWYTALLVFLTITAFFFSTWETYHTGVLYLGYINGPTEGLILACTLLTLSGVWGPGVWMNEAYNGFSYVDLFLGGMIVLLFTTQIPVSLWRVYQATKLKGKSFSEALLHIAPFCAFLGSMYTWLKAPHSSVVDQHVVLFSCCVGIVFGRVSTKIILAHVTKMEYPMFTVLMFPLFIGSLIANSPELFGTDIIFTAKLEEYYLMVYLFFAIVVYLHWTFVVVESFCDYLDIWCLRIKPKKVEDNGVIGVRRSPRGHNKKLE